MYVGARRLVPAALLLLGTLAAVPFAGAAVTGPTALLPVAMTLAALCSLFAGTLLLARFAAHGSSQLLTLGAALTLTALLGLATLAAMPGMLAAAPLIDLGDHGPEWLWRLRLASVPLLLAIGMWGVPARLRRHGAGAGTPRTESILAAIASVSAGALAALWAVSATSLPGPDRPGTRILVAVLCSVGVGLTLVRSRRTTLDPRLVVAPLGAAGALALTLVASSWDDVGWVAAALVEAATAVVVIGVLLTAGDGLGVYGARIAAATDGVALPLTRDAALAALDRLHRARRASSELTLALIEVDDIALFGERHGTLMADATVLAFGDRLRGLLRHVDLLGRVDRARFLIVMPDTGAPAATHALERITARLHALELDGERATFSAAVAPVGDGRLAVTKALASAERGVAIARSAGGDQLISPERGIVLQLRRPGA